MTTIREQTAADIAAVEQLLDAAFGSARKSKSAYGLRAGNDPVAALSFVAVKAAEILGCIRFTPVSVDVAAGSASVEGLLLLGPLAVEAAHHGQGIGQALVDHSLTKAAALGYRATILIGDPAYYGRFGFDHALVEGITVPAEADQSRVQGHEIVPGAWAGISGTLVSAPPATRR